MLFIDFCFANIFLASFRYLSTLKAEIFTIEFPLVGTRFSFKYLFILL